MQFVDVCMHLLLNVTSVMVLSWKISLPSIDSSSQFSCWSSVVEHAASSVAFGGQLCAFYVSCSIEAATFSGVFMSTECKFSYLCAASLSLIVKICWRLKLPEWLIWRTRCCDGVWMNTCTSDTISEISGPSMFIIYWFTTVWKTVGLAGYIVIKNCC